MSDIFISYKREDQTAARRLADALEKEGWSVWWDPKLRAGEHFDDVIEKALKESKCVVVIWSKLSVNSRYVRDEATYALNRKKLVPVAIEEVELPFRFESLHTLLFAKWNGAVNFPAFQKLLRDIESIAEPERSEDGTEKVEEAASEALAALSRNRQSRSDKPGTILRDTLKDGSPGPEMVIVPAGTYQMGDMQGYGEDCEKPVHTVHMQKSFAIGLYQVTFDEYDIYAKVTGRSLPADNGWGRRRRPVINVAWEEVAAYCEWLSGQTGKTYRLPTEAEWEYGARSGGIVENWSGTSREEELRDFAWYDINSEGKTQDVGVKRPNRYGLYDMSGNVWEWVEDCWHENYNDAPTDGSARLKNGDGEWDQRVVRGGSWRSVSVDLRSSFRGRGVAGTRDNGFGFRLARDLE